MKSKVRISISLLVLSSIILPLLISGSAAGKANKDITTFLPLITNQYEELSPIIPETTVVLPDETLQDLTGISDTGVFTFTNTSPALNAVKVGDVIVGDVSTPAPEGFLRKVISISPSDSQVIIQTEQATLQEAIQQGSIHITQAISPTLMLDSVKVPGVSIVQNREETDGTFQVIINNVVLIDEDGNNQTTDDQVIANGAINIDQNYIFDMNIYNGRLEDFDYEFSVETNETLQITINSSASLSVPLREIPIIPPIKLPPVTILVGTVPVVISPVLAFNISLEGYIAFDVSSGVTQQMSITNGLRKTRNISLPSTFGSFSNNFTFITPAVEDNVGFKVKAGPRLELMVYGISGPYTGIDGNLKLVSDFQNAPAWSLYGGLEVPLGIRMKIFGKTIADFNVTLFNYEKLLLQANVTPPNEMIFIPAGEFPMGCDQAHNAAYICFRTELPLHTVYLDAFFIDKYEITNAKYAQCVAAGSCTPPTNYGSYTRSSYYDNPTYANYPVNFMSWDDANNYCHWAGKRLPTEAEWEKAARGTTARAFPWGDEPANCTLANGRVSESDFCVGDTTEIGAYPQGASPYGVMDMAGNVYEWVNDWFQNDYYSISPSINPLGPTTGSEKVLRGGSYFYYWDYSRVADRNFDIQYINPWFYGFRCAASVGN